MDKKALKRANNALHALGCKYHESLPITQIEAILAENGMHLEMAGAMKK